MMRFVLEEFPAVKLASSCIWRMRRTLTNASKHATGPLSQRITHQKIVHARKCVCDLYVCVSECLFLCFCMCPLLWFYLFHQVCSTARVDWVRTENLKKCRCSARGWPTVQNIHGDWLAFAGAGMPQRLALYSNCVPKPVLFSSNLQNTKTHQPCSSSKELMKKMWLKPWSAKNCF